MDAALNEFTEEWLLEAIRAVSFCIVEDGPVYAPILDRLERELDIIRARQDAVSRARMHLEGHRQRQKLSSEIEVVRE